MGYPMTWRRLINRNGLVDGDYGEPPQRWRLQVDERPVPREGWNEGVDLADVMQNIIDRRGADAKVANSRAALFAGDLRRLERDTLDEGWICEEIARRTGAEPDTVAAVLKEWLSV